MNLPDDVATCITAQDEWKKNPLACAYSLFLDKLTNQQEAVINSVFSHWNTYVISAHGLGKSYSAAITALTFLYTYYPDAQVITFAPTWSQVEDILWMEIGKIFKNSLASKKGLKLGGELTQTKLTLSRECFAIGLSPKLEIEDEGQRVTGRHCSNQLIILDEAHGIDPQIWKYLKTLRTGANNRLLAIGNASKASGDFYNGFLSSKNHKITMDIFSSPNFVANGITSQEKLLALSKLPEEELNKKSEKMVSPFPALSSVRWALECLEDWGLDSPLFQSRVLCNFIQNMNDTLISLADLRTCKLDSQTHRSIKSLGIDPSRIKDRCVLFGLKNYQECFRLILPGMDLMKLRNIIIKHAIDGGYDIIAIDSCGLGIGLVDALMEARRNNKKIPKILPVNFGTNPISAYEEICFNLVAELWFRLQKLVEKKEIIVDDKDTLFAELSNRRYEVTDKGKIAIEKKEKYKKRFKGESPDIADALLYSLAGIFYGGARGLGLKVWGERVAGNLEYEE